MPASGRRRWLGPALVLFASALFAAVWLGREPRLIDLNSFYLAARAAATDADLYDGAVLNGLAKEAGVRGYVFPYLYPPLFAYVAIPWGASAVAAARTAWTLASLALVPALLLLAAAEARARLGGPDFPPYAFAALAPFLLPFGDNVDMGQVNLWVLLFLGLALACDRRGWSAAGGTALAVAILIKVTPALLLLWFLARRRFALAGSCLAATAALAVATLPLGALGAWRGFFAKLPAMAHGSPIGGLFPPSFLPNFSLAGFFARLFADDAGRVRMAALAAAALLAVVALAATIARRTLDAAGADLMLLPFLALMIVAAPLGYRHHVVYLLPGLVLALAYAWSRLAGGRRWLAVGTLLLLAGLAGAPFPSLYEPWGWTGIAATSLNLWALLALFALGTALALRERGAAAPPG